MVRTKRESDKRKREAADLLVLPRPGLGWTLLLIKRTRRMGRRRQAGEKKRELTNFI